MFMCQPDSGEMALEVVDQLVRSSAVDIIVVDSVAALVPRAEIEGEIGAVQGALLAPLQKPPPSFSVPGAPVCAHGCIAAVQPTRHVDVGDEILSSALHSKVCVQVHKCPGFLQPCQCSFGTSARRGGRDAEVIMLADC